ncbi:hypothetical protein ACIBBB_28685 [Streptomyces sp. NPDC051217]|uniref:hypothetical protein n=1 Tax=Streptomyces sp. NPDC051217 TaxID=3365644 RepID=UPI0037976855
MRECWFCGDPVDAGQVHRVELEGGGGPRTVEIPGCVACVHRYRAHRDEGTTAPEIGFFIALIGAPAAGAFAIGLRSSVLGAATLVLVAVFVISLVVMVRSDLRTTPRLTFKEGGWASRIGVHPEVAVLRRQGWEVKGYRSTANGPGGL